MPAEKPETKKIFHAWSPDYDFDSENFRESFLAKIGSEKDTAFDVRHLSSRHITIPNAIEKKKEEIENEDRAQDIKLKKHTHFLLFYFLGIETALIFYFSFLQATGWLGFHLEEWSFKLLVTATISQITYMLQVTVKHLFPTKRG